MAKIKKVIVYWKLIKKAGRKKKGKEREGEGKGDREKEGDRG